jgi:hypothetical protein
MAFRLGEFPGQIILKTSKESKTRCWYWEAWARALSSCTIKSCFNFLFIFLTHGSSFPLRITAWYRYQLIPPLHFSLTIALFVFLKIYLGFGLSFFFLYFLKYSSAAFLTFSCHFFLHSASIFVFLFFKSSFEALFSAAVSGSYIWQGPFL